MWPKGVEVMKLLDSGRLLTDIYHERFGTRLDCESLSTRRESSLNHYLFL